MRTTIRWRWTVCAIAVIALTLGAGHWTGDGPGPAEAFASAEAPGWSPVRDWADGPAEREWAGWTDSRAADQQNGMTRYQSANTALSGNAWWEDAGTFRAHSAGKERTRWQARQGQMTANQRTQHLRGGRLTMARQQGSSGLRNDNDKNA